MKLHSLSLGVFATVVAFFSLHAADIRWTGAAGDALWSNPLNWTGEKLPGEGDRPILNANGLIDGKLFLDASQTILNLGLAGQNYTLEATDGSVLTLLGTTIDDADSGGSGVHLACPIVVTRDTTIRPRAAWNTQLYLEGSITDNGAGCSLTFNDNQNRNVQAYSILDVTGKIILDHFSFTLMNGGIITNASGVYLQQTWSNNNLMTMRIDNRPEAINDRIAPNIPLVTLRCGGGIIFHGNKTVPVCQNFNTLALEEGAFSITVNDGDSGFEPTDIVISNIVRQSGTCIRNLKAANNSRIIVPNETALNTLWRPWCVMDGTYLSTLDEDNAITTLTFPSDDRSRDLTGSGNLPDEVYIMRQPAALPTGTNELFLAENTDIWGLILDYTKEQFLHLGSYDLRLGSGALYARGHNVKEIDSAGGRLIFSGEDVCIAYANSGVFSITASLAWDPPVPGQRPSLVIARNGGTIALEGEDTIRDYEHIAMFSQDKVLRLGGPSDRIIHGNIYGDGSLMKAGTGTLTFKGQNLTRAGSLYISDGRAIFETDIGKNINLYTNGTVEANAILNNDIGIYGPATIAGHNQIRNTYLRESDSCLTIAPGSTNAIGTLTATRSVTLGEGGGFTIKLDGTSADKLLVTGTNYKLILPTGPLEVNLVGIAPDARYRSSDRYVIAEVTHSTIDNYNAANIHITTSTPKVLNVSGAQVLLEGKTLVLTGVRGFSTNILLY